MNKKIVSFLDKTFYSKVENRWDDKIFREEILGEMKPEFFVLDIGAGRGRILEMDFRGYCDKIYGVDVDEAVKQNPLIDKAFVGTGTSMPFFEDNSFDLVFSDNVLEHVENPEDFYKEVHRVLKQGGRFLSKTPNKFHYMPIIARLTPIAFHKFYNKLRGREYEDTFPTYYRANSKKAYVKLAKNSNLKLNSLKFVSSRPEYLRLFFITYILGIIYERTVNFFKIDFLKTIIISKMEK